MQPAGQHGMSREPVGVLRQGDKGALRHILRRVRVANHAQRGGIDQINMAPHEFSKRSFGAPLGVLGQKLVVGSMIHSPSNSRRIKNRTAQAIFFRNLCLTECGFHLAIHCQVRPGSP